MIEVTIGVEDGDLSELAALSEFLRLQRRLRGRVQLRRAEPADGQLGGAFDCLAVALGSGGIGVALADALKTWFITSRTRSTIVVKTISPDGSQQVVEVPASADPAVLQAVRQMLEAAHDD